MLNYLVNRPNRVLERQRIAQTSTLPVYRRMPGSAVWLNAYFATFAMGAGMCSYSIYMLLKGKPKTE